MARSFSTEDARRMLDRQAQLLKRIDGLSDARRRAQADVSREAGAVSGSRVIAGAIMDELRSGRLRSPDDLNARNLAAALYKYQALAPVLHRLAALRAECEASTADHARALRSGASALRWLFTGRQGKDAAAAAYEALSALPWADWSAAVDDAASAVQAIGQTPANEAFAAFEAYPPGYGDALAQCAPAALSAEKPVDDIAALVRQTLSLYERYDKAAAEGKALLTAWEKQARDAVLRLMGASLLQKLRELDIEAVARQRSGLRVKTLKDAGYLTVGDVYSAAPSQLAAINGISADGAEQIKAVVDQMAERMQSGLKLRLTADDRSPEATVLVSVLHACRRAGDLLDWGNENLAPARRRAYASVRTLSTLKNNLSWMLSDASDRERWAAAFRRLSDERRGDIPRLIDEYCAGCQAAQRLDAPAAWAEFTQNPIAFFNTLEALAPGVLGNDDALYGLPEALAREIQSEEIRPDGLNVTLRRYQEWGVKYALHQGRSLLGDEMGLGKTVQALAAMVTLRNTGATHFLVVCPAGVLPNWCKEIEKKSDLRPVRIHGASRREALATWLKLGGVAVTTYETTHLIDLPDEFRYELLVVDEAHYIKNAETRRSRGVRALMAQAARLLFMTGTALENHVGEMIALIELLQPSVAGKARDIAFMASAPEFRREVAPVYYRRRREDVLTELPDKIENKEFCDLLPEEAKRYEQAVLARNIADIRRVSWTCDDLSQSSKARRMLEIIADAEEDGRKVLVFTFYRETLRKISAFLGDRCSPPIHGGVSVQRRQEIIDQFEAMPPGSVLLSQIQAGGTGLNIQAASVVIICEPQLKPSVENQAISRAYRMGQARNVLVYRLLAANTIDERLDEMLEQKQAVFDAFADRSAAAEATPLEEREIDEQTLGRLIDAEVDRIKALNGGAPLLPEGRQALNPPPQPEP